MKPPFILIRTCNAENVVIGDVQGENVIINMLRAFSQDKSVGNFYLQTGGLYLLPELVPIDGRVVQARVFGYLNDENLELVFGPNPEVVVPFLYVLAFRHERESDSYQMLQSPEKVTHSVQPNAAQMEINVKEGDRIGVFIPHDCEFDKNLYWMNCPSQINLRVEPTSCMSALYYPAESENTNIIPLDLFEEVQVDLNMEVVIAPAIGTCIHNSEHFGSKALKGVSFIEGVNFVSWCYEQCPLIIL